MSRNVFQFKAFSVLQSDSVFKIGTDGVLLGAWVEVNEKINVLEVGCGTGLISLMIAQRSRSTKITSIDINQKAIELTAQNVSASSFSSQINCVHTPFQDLIQNGISYDLIVSNPPFFKESYISGNKDKDLARHQESLSVEEFISISSQLLTDNGQIAFIYPTQTALLAITLAKTYGLHLHRMMNVRPTLQKPINRTLIQLTKQRTTPVLTEMFIEESRHNYSADYTNLTREFYLKM